MTRFKHHEESYNIHDHREKAPILGEKIISDNLDGTSHLSKCQAVILVGTALLINFFSFGFGFSLSVLYPEFVRVFDSDRSMTALIQSLYLTFILAGAILWNPCVVRYGPSWCIICGATVVTAGVFVTQFANNVWLVMIFLGVVAGIGSSITALGPFLLINDIMGKWEKAAFAMIPTGASLGQFCFTYLVEHLIEEYNWNGALLIMSGILTNMIPCGIIIYFIVKGNKNIGSSYVSNSKLFDKCVFKEWRLYLLLVVSLQLAFSVFVESKFLVDFMILKGYDRATGSLFVSYIGLANFAGRVVASALKVVF